MPIGLSRLEQMNAEREIIWHSTYLHVLVKLEIKTIPCTKTIDDGVSTGPSQSRKWPRAIFVLRASGLGNVACVWCAHTNKFGTEYNQRVNDSIAN